MRHEDLTKGVLLVSIIYQGNSPVDGHLLPRSNCQAIGSRVFALQKPKAALETILHSSAL